jgi:hypothetical protein
VRYHEDADEVELKESRRGVVREDIPIPNPGPRQVSRAELLIASIMSPTRERQMTGLTGKSLV